MFRTVNSTSLLCTEMCTFHIHTLKPEPLAPQHTTAFGDAVLCIVAQLCPVLCDPMDCSPPGSSVCGIIQARIVEWVAIPFSRRSPQSIFPIQGKNLGLLHCRQILYRLSPQGSPSLGNLTLNCSEASPDTLNPFSGSSWHPENASSAFNNHQCLLSPSQPCRSAKSPGLKGLQLLCHCA